MALILSTLRRLIPYLPAESRRFLVRFAIFSGFLAIVDVVALMALALTLASVITGGSLRVPFIGSLPPGSIPWLILLLSVVIIGKSAANTWMQWAATRRFAALEREIGKKLFSAYMRAPWSLRVGRSSAQVIQLADTGIANVNSGFLLPLLTLPGIIVTSVGVLIAIFFAQPVTAVVAVVYLGGIATLQYFVLGGRTRQAARVARDSALRVAGLLAAMYSAQKEIILRNKTDEVEEVVSRQRARTAQARANANFLSAVPRFVYDAAIIGGFAVVGGIEFLIGGLDGAISAIALFGIAGFRLVPSLTGFQSVITRTTTAIPYVDRVIRDIEDSRGYAVSEERLGTRPLPPGRLTLAFEEVSFRYPGQTEDALKGLSAVVPMGTSVGVAGRSGAGKSTMIDMILGLLTPTEGVITVSGEKVEEVLFEWRQHIGYVPQEVMLFDGTIAQNIALTWGDDIDYARVERAARRAQIWELVELRPGGMKASIGDRGSSLSGGQRQRMGIARALYTDPLVLVLDEATSALDTKTESDVAQAIRGLHGDVTVIAVAHRLSTIKDSDLILYMEDGHVVAQGTFDEVVAENGAFALQARLAGLVSRDEENE